MSQALRRTYAYLSLDNAEPSPVLPLALSSALTRTALQPLIKHPATTTSSRRRFYLPSYSSILAPRRLLLRHSLHSDHHILPPFKPGRNLYRRVLKQEFLRATKKVTKEAVTTNDLTTTDDKWLVSV
jgi:hypothetical protein